MTHETVQPAPAPPPVPVRRVQPLSDKERAGAERKLHLQRFTSGLASFPVDGTIFVQFATALGFTEFHFGIVGGLSQWLQYGAQLFASITGERTGRRKWIAFTGATLRALIVAGFAAIAFLRPQGGFVVPLVLVMVLLVRSQQGVQGSAILAWMRDVSGARNWSSSASMRMVLGRLALPLTLIYAAVVDHGRREGTSAFFRSVGGCYVAAALCAAVAAWAFARTPDPRTVWHDEEPPAESLARRIARNRPLRRYIGFAWLVALGTAFTQVFRGYYMVNVVHLSQMEIAVASSLFGAVAGAAASYLYRRHHERVSERALLCVAAGMMLVTAPAWIFATQWRWLYAVLIPAQSVALTCRALGGNLGLAVRLTPGHRRSIYLAVTNVVGSLPLLISPLVGRVIYTYREQPWTLGPVTLSTIQAAMLVGAVFFAGALVMAWRFLFTEREDAPAQSIKLTPSASGTDTA